MDFKWLIYWLKDGKKVLVAKFNDLELANDFVEYQATIRQTFIIEEEKQF